MNFVFEDTQEYRNLVRGDNQNHQNCNRLTCAPFVNLIRTLSFYNSSINNDSVHFDFNSDDIPDRYIIPVGTHNDPHNWGGGELSEYENYESVFDNLNSTYLSDLQSKKAFLLFDNSLEGFHEDWVFKFLHHECERYKIHPNQIIYITGNLMVETQYDSWLDSNPQEFRINPLPFPYFEMDVHVFTKDLPQGNTTTPPTFTEQLEYKTKNEKDIKLYSCLNKKPRSHRVNFYKLLYSNNLLDKGLVSMESFGSHASNFGGNENSKFCNHSFSNEYIDEIKKTLPSRIYGKSNEEHTPDYYVTRFHPEVTLDSWIQVISETYFYDEYPTLFVSEKTFKSIASSQPFIIMGNKNSLVELKKLGYKTFGDFWDESYDSMEGCERMDAIIQLLKDIDSIDNKLEWFSAMKDILEHNKNVITNNFVNETPYVYDKVLKLYNNDSISR